MRLLDCFRGLSCPNHDSGCPASTQRVKQVLKCWVPCSCAACAGSNNHKTRRCPAYNSGMKHTSFRLNATTIFLLASFCIAIVFAGCAAPSAQRLEDADYGVKPSREFAESTARKWILERLRDPESARITYEPLEKSWFQYKLSPFRYAWKLEISVNAKNGYGGYTGSEPYRFYFRGNELVGRCWVDKKYGTGWNCSEQHDGDWGDN